MSSDQIAIKQVFIKLQGLKFDVLLFEKEAQKTRPKSFKMVDKQVIKGTIHWIHTTTSGNTKYIFFMNVSLHFVAVLNLEIFSNVLRHQTMPTKGQALDNAY